MALLNIVTDEDEILRKKSKNVDEINNRIHILLDDMTETMRNANGVGLAAVQVGILKRVVVIECTEGEVLELINPVIISKKGEQQEIEGCLSVPGKSGICKRPEYVKVEALDRFGNKKTYEGTGLLARCFCHELDHLDGILYTDIALEIHSNDEIEKEEEE